MEENKKLYESLKSRLTPQEIVANGNKLLGAMELGYGIGFSEGFQRAEKEMIKEFAKTKK